MNIQELSLNDFNDFCNKHPLGNFYQTMNYALLKSEQGYEYEFVGYVENNNILAAALILYKKINGIYYGYAPRGILFNYNDTELVLQMTKAYKTYFLKKGFMIFMAMIV